MTLKELDSLSEKYKIPVISVDFLNHSYHTVQSKQLDNSRYLICTLTENGIPRGVKPDEIARLRLEKPDKTYVYNECETIEDGRILVTLTEQILAVNGKAQCDIQLTSADGIIYSTKNFIIHIDSTPYPLDAIKSSDEFDALNDIIAREGERIKIVEELEQTVTENEAVRNENEHDRISSENIRKANETARQNQEDARQANENIRIANENSRKANETVRQTNETNRETNTATAISNAEKATKKANDAADDLQNKLNQHHFVLTEDKDVAGGVPSLDTNRKIPVNELYEATISSKGITQLTDSVSSTSTTTAATPNSVKIVNDAVNAEKNRAITAENNLESKIHTAITGINSGDAYISVNHSENAVTINHKDVARNNTSSTAKPVYGGTFTAVKSVVSDSKGHLTGVDTETITLPNAYTHPSATAYSSGLYKITTNNLGHITSAAAVTKADITGLGIPASNTTYSMGTSSVLGLTKLYTATGSATDGTMTQKAVTEQFAKYLPLTGGTLTGNIAAKGGTTVHYAAASAGSAGFLKIAQFKITGSYQNSPIVIELSSRGREVTCTLYIYFSPVNNSDPSSANIYYTGADYDVYIHKSATSTFELYVHKSENYDRIDVIRYHKPTYMNGVGVTWTDTYSNSVPSGAVKAILKGAVNSSEKFITPRKINGVAFDGTKDITITATPASHNHGLLHSDLGVMIGNTTTDSGWSMINSTYNGYLLKSIRFQQNAPAWGYGNFAAGIAFGGADTHGVISLPYNTPAVRFAGGNGTKPAWYFSITGSNGSSYNLDNYPTKTGSGATGTWGINITGNAISSEKTLKVYSTTIEPTTATTYYLPFHVDSSNEYKDLKNNTAFNVEILKGQTGNVILKLGNNKTIGSTDSKYGKIRLYSQYSTYTDIIATNSSNNNTIYFPSKSGTLALTNHENTNYRKMLKINSGNSVKITTYVRATGGGGVVLDDYIEVILCVAGYGMSHGVIESVRTSNGGLTLSNSSFLAYMNASLSTTTNGIGANTLTITKSNAEFSDSYSILIIYTYGSTTITI